MRRTLLPIWRRPRTKGATEAVYSGATESHQGTWDFLSHPPCSGFCPSKKSTLNLHKESSQKVPKVEENLLYICIWIHAHVYISVYEERERGAREREWSQRKKKRDETFPNESYFSHPWPDISLSINWMFPNEVNGVMEREYHYWPINWPAHLRETQSSLPTNNNRAWYLNDTQVC